MKDLFAQNIEDKFEVLTNEELLVIRGGEELPRSKDKDIFDLEED